MRRLVGALVLAASLGGATAGAQQLLPPQNLVTVSRILDEVPAPLARSIFDGDVEARGFVFEDRSSGELWFVCVDRDTRVAGYCSQATIAGRRR